MQYYGMKIKRWTFSTPLARQDIHGNVHVRTIRVPRSIKACKFSQLVLEDNFC